MREEHDQKDNVIQMPGLVERLVDFGMNALKEKRLYDALTYFNQVTQLDEDHPQGRYGLVIANIELNRLEEARIQCESMLEEGLGDYYDVLKIYISLLVQLTDYERVVEILDEALPLETMPSEMAESFEELLKFAREMVEDDSSKLRQQADDHDMSVTTGDLINTIQQGNTEEQWGAIHKLSHREKSIAVEAYRELLASDGHHPVLKSYVLSTLEEMGIKEQFDVHKFGHTYQVNLADANQLFHREEGMKVVRLIRDQLEAENPSLLSLAEQLWWHYLFAIYPVPLQGSGERAWAGALHMHLEKLMNQEGMEVEDFAEIYGTGADELISCCKHIEEIELLLHHFEIHMTDE
ncbi:DUF3196 family protein [Salisediminibacterium beveridgei]|uniref:TPR repeat protein n=1 Tax=Salisediminibacterium beveridgei TaxID=632773 RepID=A0A1D7QTH9_9BACI|nr:DUF3196 family protein [Salisediminibacterium beveridgei]AOM82326.1 TPR repeat protein [Salisediminibacterium beveridgei]